MKFWTDREIEYLEKASAEVENAIAQPSKLKAKLDSLGLTRSDDFVSKILFSLLYLDKGDDCLSISIKKVRSTWNIMINGRYEDINLDYYEVNADAHPDLKRNEEKLKDFCKARLTNTFNFTLTGIPVFPMVWSAIDRAKIE